MTAFAVYRAFDSSGRLLYVGQTNDIERRLRWHSRQSLWSWWPSTTRVEVADFDTRPDALAAEREAIQTEFPRWNITHRSPGHPEGVARAGWEVREKWSA